MGRVTAPGARVPFHIDRGLSGDVSSHHFQEVEVKQPSMTGYTSRVPEAEPAHSLRRHLDIWL